MATAACSVWPSVGSPRWASRSSSEELSSWPAEWAPTYAASARRRLRSDRSGLRSAARRSRVTAPTTSPRCERAVRAVLDRGGDVLVGRDSSPRRGGGPAVPAGPRTGRPAAGAPSRRSSCVDRSTTTDLIIGCRKTISPARSSTTTRWSRSAGSSSSRFPVPLDAARTPRLPEPSSTASRSRRRVDSGRRSTLASYRVRTSRLEPGGRGGVRWPVSWGSPIEAANSSSASGLPCASWATSRRTRVGRWANWWASSSMASDSARGGDVELREAGAFEEPARAGSGGPEQPDPAARETPADEPDDRAGGAIEPVHVVDDDEQRGAGCRLAEQLQRCGQHREPVRCGPGPDAERHLDRDARGPGELPQVVGQADRPAGAAPRSSRRSRTRHRRPG